MPDVPTRIAYTVGGTPQSAFVIPFAFFDVAADITVYVGGVAATYNAAPTGSSQFSVVGTAVDGGYTGGTATLGAAVSNTTVIIERATPIARTEDFPYPSPTINIKALNTALDKIAAWGQQLKTSIARAAGLAPSSTATGPIYIPDPSAAKFLRWNAGATNLENADITGAGSIGIPVSLAQGGSGATTAAGARTAFGLGTAAVLDTGTAANKVVALDGSAKLPAVDGSQLTGITYLPRSYLAGLMLSRNSGTPNTKMDIAAGACRDDGDAVGIFSATVLTVDLTVNGANGLDTGSKANSTWYHFFAIMKADGTKAGLASISATSPTMPSGYVYKRRVGSGRTDGSGNLLAFTQDGDYFRWAAAASDVNVSNPGTAAVARTLTVPTGVNVHAHIAFYQDGTGAVSVIYLSDLAANDEAPSAAAGIVTAHEAGAAPAAWMGMIRTNTSGQIRSRIGNSVAGTAHRLTTLGWIDARGRTA